MGLQNLEGLQPKDAQGHSKSSISQVFTSQIDPSLTWDFIAWVRSISSLPIFVKVSRFPQISPIAWACRVMQEGNIIPQDSCRHIKVSCRIEKDPRADLGGD